MPGLIVGRVEAGGQSRVSLNYPDFAGAKREIRRNDGHGF
jgi:hypothetical protein